MLPNQFGKSFVDILLEQKAISKADYDSIKMEVLNTGKSEEQVIQDHDFVKEEDFIKAKSVVYNIPIFFPHEVSINPECSQFFTEMIARKYAICPFRLDKSLKLISVAMKDPLDVQTVEFLERKTGYKVVPYIALNQNIDLAISELYGQGLTSEVSEAVIESKKEFGDDSDVNLTNIEQFKELVREAPVAKIVSTMVEFAIKTRASDVHIEPLPDKTRIRYRIDGILQEKLTLPKNIHEAVISRIKILSGLKIDEKRLPQDGRFNFNVSGLEVDLRVSTLPTVNGEKVVMRLLRKTAKVPTLQDLGLRGIALKHLEDNMKKPHGIILITGPTGSGKTTTLYSIFSILNTSRVNISTLEDPVEYQIVGVNQVQINPAAGLTFASGLRSFLRQDPNIILVGEIRDSETVVLAIQAALTGHLVFSTLHTNSAAGAIPRLLDMGAENFLIASSLNCLAGQRICRQICNDCKEEYEPSPEIVEDIKNILGSYFPKDKQIKLYRGKGCAVCSKTGYLGRIAIFEVLPITDKIVKLILQKAAVGEIEKQAIEEGMITMKQDGYLKVVEGITTIEEVLRVAQE
jgi:type IV pilus assembly protein PilB